MKRHFALICALALTLLGAAKPMDDVATIHAILSSLPPWHGETETAEERSARLGVIAAAIAVASEGDRERAIALVVQAWSETRLAAHIHRGECEGHPKSFRGECDAEWIKEHGRRVRVWRARNLWQVHVAPRADLKALWERSLGEDLGPTANAARLADHLLRARRCGGNLAEMYSAQGNGLCVARPSGTKRAALHRKLRRQWEVEAAK